MRRRNPAVISAHLMVLLLSPPADCPKTFTVQIVAKYLGVNHNTVWKTLDLLRRVGLLTDHLERVHRSGRRVLVYSLNPNWHRLDPCLVGNEDISLIPPTESDL